MGGRRFNRIAIVTRTDSQGRAVVEIVDSGPGMLPENLPRLFTPFFSDQATGDRQRAGAGHLPADRARDLGGDIEVHSSRRGNDGAHVATPGPAAHAGPPRRRARLSRVTRASRATDPTPWKLHLPRRGPTSEVAS